MKPAPPSQALFKAADVAPLVGLSSDHLDKLRQSGRIPSAIPLSAGKQTRYLYDLQEVVNDLKRFRDQKNQNGS